MKKIKITAIRKACYPDLMEKYENPIEHACDVQEGQVWISNGWQKPEGMCDKCMGEYVGLRDDTGARWRGFLRWLDEEPQVGYDQL